MAQDVISTLLEQKDDALDHDLAALRLKMRKDLDEDQLDDCIAETQQVVMKHIKKSCTAWQFGQQRGEYLLNPDAAAPREQEDEFMPMPPAPMAPQVMQEMYQL